MIYHEIRIQSVEMILQVGEIDREQAGGIHDVVVLRTVDVEKARIHAVGNEPVRALRRGSAHRFCRHQLARGGSEHCRTIRQQRQGGLQPIHQQVAPVPDRQAGGHEIGKRQDMRAAVIQRRPVGHIPKLRALQGRQFFFRAALQQAVKIHLCRQGCIFEVAGVFFDREAAQSLPIPARNDVHRAEFRFGCGLQCFCGGWCGRFAEQELKEKDVLKRVLRCPVLLQNRLRRGLSAALFGWGRFFCGFLFSKQCHGSVLRSF